MLCGVELTGMKCNPGRDVRTEAASSQIVSLNSAGRSAKVKGVFADIVDEIWEQKSSCVL